MRKRGGGGNTYLKDGIDTLPLGIANCSQPVAGNGTSQQSRDIGDDEPQRAAARAAQHAPEPVIRRAIRVRHTFLAEHFFKDVAKLLTLGFLSRLCLRPRVRRAAAARSLVGEEIPCPAIGRLVGVCARARVWYVVVVVLGKGVACCGFGRGRGATKEFSLAVIFPAAGAV